MSALYASKVQIRVRYGETDQMGYVYYGNYAEYFEVARVEMLRELGVSYQELEKNGTMLPVYDLHVRYKEPARYDELLTIETELVECTLAKIIFAYRVFNEEGRLLNVAETTLVFVDKESGKPKKAPAEIIASLAKL